MFSVECARIEREDAVWFVLADDVSENHEDWVELQVLFTVDAVYGPEPDVGAGVTGDVRIAEISVRTFGPGKPLSGDDLEAARDFLVKHYRHDLAEASEQAADLVFYDEA